jgi:hypothetical protein
MPIDPRIPMMGDPVFDGAAALERGFSLRDAARRSQMQEAEYAQVQQDRVTADNRRQQFGQALGGMVPPELAEFAKADPEGAMKLWEFKKTASAEQKAAAMEVQTVLGNAASTLRNVPYEQRWQALEQMAPQLAQMGVSPEQLQGFDPTDGAIDGIVAQTLGVKGVLEFADKAEGRRLTARGQDITVNGQSITMRGQDMTAASAAATRGVTMRGQNISAANSQGGGGGRAPSGYRFKPDGTLEAIPGGPAGAGKPLTEDQGKSTGNYRVMRQAAETLNGVKGYNPTVIANALDKGDLTGTSLNQVDRRALNAQRAFVVAALRMESGATYGPGEVVDKVRTLFPVPGDGAEVLADKSRLRQQFLGAARDRGGPGVASIPRLRAAAPQASAGSDNLRPGMVQDGYRYKGGNKADPKSWVKVAR